MLIEGSRVPTDAVRTVSPGNYARPRYRDYSAMGQM
jgi:hypothetical protein